MSVEVTKIQKFRNARGEYWYKFGGCINGQMVRDTVELDAPTVESLGMPQTIEKVKRQLVGLQRYFDEQDTAQN